MSGAARARRQRADESRSVDGSFVLEVTEASMRRVAQALYTSGGAQQAAAAAQQAAAVAHAALTDTLGGLCDAAAVELPGEFNLQLDNKALTIKVTPIKRDERGNIVTARNNGTPAADGEPEHVAAAASSMNGHAS